jgi:hypothetical protein
MVFGWAMDELRLFGGNAFALALPPLTENRSFS